VKSSQSEVVVFGHMPNSHPVNSHDCLEKTRYDNNGFSNILSKGEIRVYFNGGNQSLTLTAKNKGSVELFSE